MTSHLLQRIPDVTSDQKESAELAKLIRKLRWIGRDDEARSMEHQLTLLASTHRASVLSEPLSTD